MAILPGLVRVLEMGMYTEIFVKATLRSDISDIDLEALKWLARMTESEPENLPVHEFFKKPRASQILSGCSYYHQPKPTINLFHDGIAGQWFLVSRADLKNYDGEIESFFDWLKTVVEMRGMDKTFIGYYLYEEDDTPTMVFLEQSK